MINKLRATYRLILFAFGSIYFILRYLIKAAIQGHNLDRALRLRRQWFQIINKLVGAVIIREGELPSKAGLLVCNHRSYFDPIVVMSEILALPVGKIEVTKWPIIGQGAKVSGSIFVDRKSPEGRKKARQEILEKISNGYFIVNYPEGTTHINAQTIDFKPALFRDAAELKFPIYPIVQEYQEDADAFIDDDTFLMHFFKCFGKKNTYIKVSYGPMIIANDPEELVAKSKAWIDSELIRLRNNWHHSDPMYLSIAHEPKDQS